MGAVDCKDLELLALNSADPARSAVGLSVRDTGNGVLKLGQPGLAFREFIQLTEGDPPLVLPAIAT